MDKTVFDGDAFVSIDLSTGRIVTPGQERLALVPIQMLTMLPAGDALEQAASTWGKSHGRKLIERVAADSTSIASLSTHLGGTLAALGMGRVTLELRHDALLFRMMEDDRESAPGGAAIVVGFISGYLSAVSGRTFVVLDLGEVDGARRFWAASPKAVQEVRSSIEKGVGPLDAIDALMTGEAAC